MSILHSSMLQSYRLVTHRWRRRIRDELTRNRQLPAAILFYHRVADTDPNDWTIGRGDFDRHLDWIADHGRFATIGEIQQGQKAGQRAELQVAITFDDGYAENCDWALPRLLNRGVPCTYFVTVDQAARQYAFPHDVRRGRPLPVNNVEQIREFAQRGIEIGCHSWSHLDLGLPHDAATLRREIVDSRAALQDWTGQSIDFFAFPFGMPQNVSQAAIDAVCEAGYRGFVSAYGGWNWPGEDAFHLQRIHGDPGIVRLSNWLTLDPRKLRRGSRIAYRGAPLCGAATPEVCEAAGVS